MGKVAYFRYFLAILILAYLDKGVFEIVQVIVRDNNVDQALKALK